MLFAIFVVLYLGSIVQFTEGSPKSRCAVVIFVNQSSFNSEEDFSEYMENIRGLSSNLSSVYFSEEPDLFKVRHGNFINAPGLFALESQKFPGKFLRRANHRIVLEDEQSTDDFRNDATFLMDHAEKNETYTTLKLFSHRSWKLSSNISKNSPLYFDEDNVVQAPELLVVAQQCPQNDKERQQVVKSPKPSSPHPNIEPKKFASGSGTGHKFQEVTEKPPAVSTNPPTLNATVQRFQKVSETLPAVSTNQPTLNSTGLKFQKVTEKPPAVSTNPPTLYGIGRKFQKVSEKPPAVSTDPPTLYAIGRKFQKVSEKSPGVSTDPLTLNATGHKFQKVSEKSPAVSTDPLTLKATGHKFQKVSEKPPVVSTDPPTLYATGHKFQKVSEKSPAVSTDPPTWNATGHKLEKVSEKPPVVSTDPPTLYATGHKFQKISEKSPAVSTDPLTLNATGHKFQKVSEKSPAISTRQRTLYATGRKFQKVTVKHAFPKDPNLNRTTDSPNTKQLTGLGSKHIFRDVKEFKPPALSIDPTSDTKYLTNSGSTEKFQDTKEKNFALAIDSILNGNAEKYLTGSGTRHEFRDVTEKPHALPTDPILNGNAKTKYLTAITNKGNWKTIPNEYSFDDFEVPNFIVNSLVENAKSATDGVEAPKPEAKPATVIENKTPQQPLTEHTNKSPTTKQKIGDLHNLLSDPELEDIEDSLKDLQYGSKGCKLLVAEDTSTENAASKDTVARPKIKKGCLDEFPEACVEMANKGYCLAFKSLMSSVCRKSCKLCPRMLDTGFTSCTRTCGGGRQMRMIKINRREYLQTRRCNRNPCPINGGYSDFGPYTECSVTCGQGVQYRRRTCTKPRPQYNGSSCRRLGPSIESRRCHAGPCPGHRKKINKEKTRKIRNSHHHKAALHIGGPHSDKVHRHSILLEGRKVAKLRCAPRRGALRSIIQDSPTKTFTVHPLKRLHSSKKSSVEESEIVYNKEGLPVDTARTVVNAFKAPYKIILRRKGPNDMKLLEECVRVDDTLKEDDGLDKHHEGNLIYTRPDEKSYSDFDEYKYETGNIVTPQVMASHDNNDHDYSAANGNLFPETKGLDLVLSKMNSISPSVDGQLSQEQNLESSFKTENAHPVNGWSFPGPEERNERGDDTDTDKDNYGYNVETMADR